MSLSSIQVVDVTTREPIELDDLTETALGSLVWECEQLLDRIKDAHRKEADANP